MQQPNGPGPSSGWYGASPKELFRQKQRDGNGASSSETSYSSNQSIFRRIFTSVSSVAWESSPKGGSPPSSAGSCGSCDTCGLPKQPPTNNAKKESRHEPMSRNITSLKGLSAKEIEKLVGEPIKLRSPYRRVTHVCGRSPHTSDTSSSSTSKRQQEPPKPRCSKCGLQRAPRTSSTDRSRQSKSELQSEQSKASTKAPSQEEPKQLSADQKRKLLQRADSGSNNESGNQRSGSKQPSQKQPQASTKTPSQEEPKQPSGPEKREFRSDGTGVRSQSVVRGRRSEQRPNGETQPLSQGKSKPKPRWTAVPQQSRFVARKVFGRHSDPLCCSLSSGSTLKNVGLPVDSSTTTLKQKTATEDQEDQEDQEKDRPKPRVMRRWIESSLPARKIPLYAFENESEESGFAKPSWPRMRRNPFSSLESLDSSPGIDTPQHIPKGKERRYNMMQEYGSDSTEISPSSSAGSEAGSSYHSSQVTEPIPPHLRSLYQCKHFKGCPKYTPNPGSDEDSDDNATSLSEADAEWYYRFLIHYFDNAIDQMVHFTKNRAEELRRRRHQKFGHASKSGSQEQT